MSKSLQEQIAKLREKLNAIILAHNYQRPEVQDIADYTGDSLELSRRAAGTDANNWSRKRLSIPGSKWSAMLTPALR
jgi:quinolinate synthase